MRVPMCITGFNRGRGCAIWRLYGSRIDVKEREGHGMWIAVKSDGTYYDREILEGRDDVNCTNQKRNTRYGGQRDMNE